jgi:5-formyltetrahydrofolate cyclo-ligase
MEMDESGDSAVKSARPRRFIDPVRAKWRSDLRAARAALADRAEREAALADRVERWLVTVPVRRIGFFWPTRAEPDLAPLIARWLANDPARLASLPVIEGPILRFDPWSAGAPLERGQIKVQITETASASIARESSRSTPSPTTCNWTWR